jgi:FkbM family methyltransferase
MKKSNVLETFFSALPSVVEHHAHDTKLYALLKEVVQQEIQTLFQNNTGDYANFGPFGELNFPYHSMGDIDSLNLFEIDELILFGFYWANRNRYKNVLDIGANLGLHSILLSKCGFEVTSYEPDPTHFKILKENLSLNRADTVHPINKAVSLEDGEAEFVRVLGNTTGSHLSGAKQNPYGDLERFNVKLAGIRPLMKGIDFVKLDIEAHEKEVIVVTEYEDWKNTDGMLSVHDESNAKVLFDHFNDLGIKMFSQKVNWGLAKRLEDVPINHHEGTLFVTAKDIMPWGADENI